MIIELHSCKIALPPYGVQSYICLCIFSVTFYECYLFFVIVIGVLLHICCVLHDDNTLSGLLIDK